MLCADCGQPIEKWEQEECRTDHGLHCDRCYSAHVRIALQRLHPGAGPDATDAEVEAHIDAMCALNPHM